MLSSLFWKQPSEVKRQGISITSAGSINLTERVLDPTLKKQNLDQ